MLARIEGVEVDFRPSAKLFEENGQRVLESDGIVISSISAKTKISLVSEAIEQVEYSRSPTAFVRKPA